MNIKLIKFIVFFYPSSICHEDVSGLDDTWVCNPHPKHLVIPNSRFVDNIDILGPYMLFATHYMHHGSHTAAETSWQGPAMTRVGFNVITRPQESRIPLESHSHFFLVANDKSSMYGYMMHRTRQP